MTRKRSSSRLLRNHQDDIQAHFSSIDDGSSTRAWCLLHRRVSLEAEMTTFIWRAGLITALIGAAACGTGDRPMDEAMKHDLAAVAGNGVELAPRPQSQVVISAIEAGAASAPVVAPRKATPKAPSPSVARVASAPEPRQSVSAEPDRHAVAAPRATTEPPPLPPAPRATAARQSGTYKTEAEVFRQMPWIKP